MATGDYSVYSGEITTADVTFQPSAGVSVVVKTFTAEYNNALYFVNFENQDGDGLGSGSTAANRAMRYMGKAGGPRGGMLYFNCTIFMDNSSYLQLDGVGSTGKGYYVAAVQIS